MESPIGIQALHRICAPPCSAEQMLIPQPGQIRRWLTGEQLRPITQGLFLPIWWDIRLGRATVDHDRDTDTDLPTLLQTELLVQKPGIITCRTLELDHDDSPRQSFPEYTDTAVDDMEMHIDQDSFEDIHLQLPLHHEDPASPWTLVTHGLALTHVDTRRVQVPSLDRAVLQREVRDAWADYNYAARIIFVNPNPGTGSEIHAIVEFFLSTPPPPHGIPLLSRTFNGGGGPHLVETGYFHNADNYYNLLLQARLQDRCQPWGPARCNVRLQGRMLQAGVHWQLTTGAVLDFHILSQPELDDILSFMQEISQPEQADSPTPEEAYLVAHTFHMSTSYKFAQVERIPSLSLIDQLSRLWKPPRDEVITAVHEVLEPPHDLQSSADSTFLVEMSQDTLRKATDEDCQALVDIQLADRRAREQGIKIRKVVWLRPAMTREQVVHLLGAQTLCHQVDITCTLWHNKIYWPDTDTAHRQMQNGDFIHILIRSVHVMNVKEIYHGLCMQEEADTTRFLYRRSPSPSPQAATPTHARELPQSTAATHEEPEEETEEGRSRSRSRSLSLLQTASRIQRTPLGDITNTQMTKTPQVSPCIEAHPSDSIKPHVPDLWCAAPSLTVEPPCLGIPDSTMAEGKHSSTKTTKIDFTDIILDFQWLDTHLFLPQYSMEVPWPHCAQEWIDLPGMVPDFTCTALWVYFDGSHIRAANTAGAGIVAFAQTTDGWKLCGMLSTPLAPGTDAYGAEAFAALIATKFTHDLLKLLLLSEGQPLEVHLVFDNTSVGCQTIGTWACHQRPHVGKAIRHMVQMIEKRFAVHIDTHHVYGHTGDPGNEIVDTLARQAAEGQATDNLIDFLDYLTQDKYLESSAWFWMLFRNEFATMWTGWTLEIPAQPTTTPALHILDSVENFEEDQDPATCHLQHKIATANVLSLLGPARRETILRQFHSHEFQLFAMQETRLKKHWKDLDDRYIIVKSAATDQGHFGMAICFSKQIPHGTLTDCEGNSTPVTFSTEDIAIIASEPRYLIVRVTSAALRCLAIAVHAPHTGASEESRVAYWDSILGAISPRYAGWDKLLLGDLNCRLGSEISEAVGAHQAETGNGKERPCHEFLLAAGIWLPSTFEATQVGEAGTWQHTSGQWARNDFVGLPKGWIFQHCSAWVETDIDLSMQKTDHCVAAAACEATFCVRTPTKKKRRKIGEQAISNFINAGHRLLPPEVSWDTDVHTHADILQQTICRTLRKHDNQHCPVQRKTTLTEDTWQLVCQKKETRKYLAELNTQQKISKMGLMFHLWRGVTPTEVASFEDVIQSQDIQIAKTLHAFRTLGRQVTASVRRDDSHFYHSLAAEAAEFTEPSQAKRFWQIIRRSLPHLRQRWQGHDPLQLEVLEGQWNPHFQGLEVGETTSGCGLSKNATTTR